MKKKNSLEKNNESNTANWQVENNVSVSGCMKDIQRLHSQVIRLAMEFDDLKKRVEYIDELIDWCSEAQLWELDAVNLYMLEIVNRFKTVARIGNIEKVEEGLTNA